MSTDQTIELTTLSELVSNEQYARKVLPFIKSEYFADRTERILFEEIQKFVEKYNALPTKSTLEIEIENKEGVPYKIKLPEGTEVIIRKYKNKPNCYFIESKLGNGWIYGEPCGHFYMVG